MIDDHAHPFPLQFAPLAPEETTLDVEPGPDAARRRSELGPGRLASHLMLAELAELLDVSIDEVIEARDAAARADWPGWVRRLFAHAGITGMLLDAWVGPEAGQHPLAPAEHAKLADIPIWHMARVDPLVDSLLADGADAGEVVARVETFLSEAAAAGAVAFKTIIAYRTGLAVAPDVDLAAAQRGLAADAASGLPVRRRGKALRDLVTRTLLAQAVDLGRPVQVHTGFGDSEIRLGEADPLLLEELLRTPEGRAATVVLIHGSYPWEQQAAYLAAVRPNVWVELSLSNLFAPLRTQQRLGEILELAPRGRVLLGSDGHGQPETHWFGCRVLAKAWRGVAEQLRDAGAHAGWVDETQRAIFEQNARAVYSLR